MTIQKKLITALGEIAKDLTGDALDVHLEHPEDESHGDFATNLSFALAKKMKASPISVAETIKEKLLEQNLAEVGEVTVAAPGFVNITLTSNYLITELHRVLSNDEVEKSSDFEGKRIMVEYAHPNTHKEMHIGHMRTLITGESLSRILETVGSKLFRANYQGDIGPHVAKAIYGIQKLMQEEELSLSKVESWNNVEKAHFLGRGYTVGSQEYDENKDIIDNINMQLYTFSKIKSEKLPPEADHTLAEKIKEETSPEVSLERLYEITRKWSLDYYDEFYSRFDTKFDKLFFESEMVGIGRKIVEENISKVFVKDNGAIVFPGENYSLHTRVFITQAGNPTYEGKEMGNAHSEYEAFPFDMKIHIVGSEQAGYFKVVFKALELIDPEKFEDKQHHLSMGMVNLVGGKMSSRTGEILRVDWLLEQVKQKVDGLMSEGRIQAQNREAIEEQITIGAVKYSVLKVGATQDVAFDIERSVSLEGDSGPYLQYAYARTQSVLRKAKGIEESAKGDDDFDPSKLLAICSTLEAEELHLLRLLSRFDEVVAEAAVRYAPNIICTYLYELSSSFNLFYQKHQILKAEGEVKEFRLALTSGVGKRIQKGLYLLGIQAPEKM